MKEFEPTEEQFEEIEGMTEQEIEKMLQENWDKEVKAQKN